MVFFQNGNYFGLEQWQFAIIVIVICIVIDQTFDNLISPRLLGDTLGLHPAAVLIMAIIAANLLGVVGLVLAAPVLATLMLFGRYTMRKMLDMDPFPEETVKGRLTELRWTRLRAFGRYVRNKFTLNK